MCEVISLTTLGWVVWILFILVSGLLVIISLRWLIKRKKLNMIIKGFLMIILLFVVLFCFNWFRDAYGLDKRFVNFTCFDDRPRFPSDFPGFNY